MSRLGNVDGGYGAGSPAKHGDRPAETGLSEHIRSPDILATRIAVNATGQAFDAVAAERQARDVAEKFQS